MNSKLAKLMSTVLIATTLLAILPTLAIAFPAPPTMYLSPDVAAFMTGTTPINSQFTVTLYENINVGHMYTWQVKIYFNPAQLYCVSGGYNPGPKSEWAGHADPDGNTVIDGTVPVAIQIDNVGGTVLFGESLQGDDFVPAGGPWALANFVFRIIASPPMGGSLTSTIDINNVDTYMLLDDLSEIPGVTKAGTAYSYTWTAPGPAHFAIDYYKTHTSRDFGPYPPSAVGVTFDETVSLIGLDANWYCTHVIFDLTYVPTLLQVNNVAIDPLWTVSTVDTTVPGVVHVDASAPSANPSGDVLIATITFQIIYQDSIPPQPLGYYDASPLIIAQYSAAGTIPVDLTAPVNGEVRIYALMALLPPHLSVSDATMGPEPAVGETFTVAVSLNDLDWHWYLEGIQFRLKWPGCDTSTPLIWPVAVTEGPFLGEFAGAPNGGTWFVAYVEDDPIAGWNVLVGNLILPDEAGVWHEPFAGGTGVIAYITFEVLYQSYGEADVSGPLYIIEQEAIGLNNPVDQIIITLPLMDPDNGVYTITTDLPGRMLDLYGGAVNSHLIEPDTQQIWQFVPPYGGQGPNMPMDLVEPQSWVWLHANVTYNYWPVQHKLVGFEIIMPNGELYANLFAFTDENGVATVGFRMPWPCDNPESLFGVWWVISTVQVADEVIRDDLWFHYDYIVNITKVTTDKYQYNHGEYVLISIEYTSHAQQYYPVLIKCSVMDELGVVIGECRQWAEVGGAVFCQAKSFAARCTIYIPKWAYAGIATVHVNVFSNEPVYGGVPMGPEFTPYPTIAIQPY